VTTQANCTGVWTMFGNCDPNTCAQPNGACCFPDGSCTLTTQIDCAAPGVWHAEWTSCSPNPCPQPPSTGACCFTDGTCQVLTQAECLAGQGAYQGDNVACTPTLCPPPTPTEKTSWGQIKALYR
jgi:hypothetical protein